MVARLYFLNLKALSRNPGALLLILALPALYSVLFGLVSRLTEREVNVALVTSQVHANSGDFMRAITADGSFRVTQLESEEEIREAFRTTRLDAALIVPDLERDEHVTLVFDERRPERLPQTRARIQSFIERYNFSSSGGGDRVELDVRGLRGPERPLFEYALGSVIMFSVVLAALNLGATRAIRDRERGVHKRLLVTPLSPTRYLLADAATQATSGVVQTAVVLTVGIVAYDLPAKTSYLWLFPVAIGGVIILLSIGFVLASVVESTEAAVGLANTLGILLIFLSGGIPQDLFPPRLIQMGEYLPFRAMVEAIRGVVIDGGPLWRAAPRETAILAAWLIVSVALAFRLFKFREPSRKV